MIDKETIQRLRDLPIEGVAERLGMSVSRHRSLCPFHDDRVPSLTFYQKKNMYRCFVCNAAGGTIDLVMNRLHKTFADACRWLADESNIIIAEEEKKPQRRKKEARPFDACRYSRYFERPVLNERATAFLFAQRRLDPRVVAWCRLNSYKDWLQIPYFDISGKLVGVQQRYLGEDKTQPRFRFPQGVACHIYNLPVLELLKPGEPLFIAEGCSDCWAMLSSGHKAIAIPSATLLKADDVTLLRTCHEKLGTVFHMFPDNDAPGQRLFLELNERLTAHSEADGQPSPAVVHHLLPEEFKDYSEYYLSKTKPSET